MIPLHGISFSRLGCSALDCLACWRAGTQSQFCSALNMLNAVNINLVAFGVMVMLPDGRAGLAIIVFAVAAAEVAVGLALVISVIAVAIRWWRKNLIC